MAIFLDSFVRGVYSLEGFLHCYEDDEKLQMKLEKEKPVKWLYHNHGPKWDGLIEKAKRFAYEYVHGAYGLGHAVWYTYPQVAVIAKDGKCTFIGATKTDWGCEILMIFNCPKNWKFYQLIDNEEKIMESSTVAVSKYEPSLRPKSF